MQRSVFAPVTYPNASTAADPIAAHSLRCPARGCLFNVALDAEERHDVGAEHPELSQQLLQEMDALGKSIWSTSHSRDPMCLEVARSRWGGFYGPWLEL